MAAITDYKGNKDNLTNCEYSGLMNYLFGKNRDKEINRETFKQLQRDLMDDILWLEFSRYSEDGKTISDVKLCEHLLLCANLTSKQRRQMVREILYKLFRLFASSIQLIVLNLNYFLTFFCNF